MRRLLAVFALSATALLALGAAPAAAADDDTPHDIVCKVGLLPPLFCAND
ncbi:hypothetical protein [Nocardiopsis potens]|nr:hypothetical protein [Nocardiopsis potens]